MNDTIRIFFVDDDEDEFIILEDFLKEIPDQKYSIDWVPTFDKAVEKINTAPFDYDICLFDYRLGIFTGLELIKHLQENNLTVPSILLTGQGDSKVDKEAMKIGASDYLVKGKIDSNLLERSIRYSINQFKIQQQLLEQEKNLRESEKFAITGRIALVIAHEVRNPLTNIKLALYQLREELNITDQNILLLYDIAERNTDRINQLISNLLESTKFSQLKMENISINRLFDETIALAVDRIELQGVKVIRHYEGDICDISVDKEKIKIALLNIIVNSIEAMEKNKGILSVFTSTKNDKCVLTIKDNGKGIEKEDLNRIFEPYFTGKEKGIGLGLTSTQTIIYNHSGTIQVESQVSRGTTFTISFDFASHKPASLGSEPSSA